MSCLPLHPMLVAGVERFPFASHAPDDVTHRYVADDDRTDAVRAELDRLMTTKQPAKPVRLDPVRVDAIPPDPTGKTPVIYFQPRTRVA